MKLEKITHDHLLTKWLKVIIFSILILAPIFSVAVRCAYVVCNKNAYQSYSDNTAQTEFIKSGSDFNYDIEYYLINARVTTQTDVGNAGSNRVYFTSFEIIDNSTNLNLNNVASVGFYRSGNYLLNYFYDNTNTLIGSSDSYYKARVCIANFLSGFNDVIANNNILYTINGANTLDNVFDYSVNQLKNDQLFNWTQNTGVYTGVNAMTTGLGLTDGTISILITYWTLLSIIYVIIDIVIEGFVALTHMILKKAS